MTLCWRQRVGQGRRADGSAVAAAPRSGLRPAGGRAAAGAGRADRGTRSARSADADLVRSLSADCAARRERQPGTHRRHRQRQPEAIWAMALAARPRRPTGRQIAHGGCVDRRLRHRIFRARPHVAETAARCAQAARPGQSRDHAAPLVASRPRRAAGGGDQVRADGHGVHPREPGRDRQTRRQGGLCVCRRPAAALCRDPRGGDRRSARAARSRRRQWLSQSHRRLGRDRPPRAAR